MNYSFFVALIGLVFAFASSPADVLSQSLVDGHVSVRGFDISKSPTCDLAEAPAPSGALAYDGYVKHEFVPVDKGERSFRWLASETVDAEQLFREVAQNSQRRYYCVQPNEPSDEQRDSFNECVEELPDCDRRRWETSEDGGSFIVICHCRWLFSSC